MDIIRQLKREVAQATADWHRERTARAHGRMTAATGRLALVRWLLRAGYSELRNSRPIAEHASASKHT